MRHLTASYLPPAPHKRAVHTGGCFEPAQLSKSNPTLVQAKPPSQRASGRSCPLTARLPGEPWLANVLLRPAVKCWESNTMLDLTYQLAA